MQRSCPVSSGIGVSEGEGAEGFGDAVGICVFEGGMVSSVPTLMALGLTLGLAAMSSGTVTRYW